MRNDEKSSIDVVRDRQSRAVSFARDRGEFRLGFFTLPAYRSSPPEFIFSSKFRVEIMRDRKI